MMCAGGVCAPAVGLMPLFMMLFQRIWNYLNHGFRFVEGGPSSYVATSSGRGKQDGSQEYGTATAGYGPYGSCEPVTAGFYSGSASYAAPGPFHPVSLHEQTPYYQPSPVQFYQPTAPYCPQGIVQFHQQTAAPFCPPGGVQFHQQTAVPYCPPGGVQFCQQGSYSGQYDVQVAAAPCRERMGPTSDAKPCPATDPQPQWRQAPASYSLSPPIGAKQPYGQKMRNACAFSGPTEPCCYHHAAYAAQSANRQSQTNNNNNTNTYSYSGTPRPYAHTGEPMVASAVSHVGVRSDPFSQFGGAGGWPWGVPISFPPHHSCGLGALPGQVTQVHPSTNQATQYPATQTVVKTPNGPMEVTHTPLCGTHTQMLGNPFVRDIPDEGFYWHGMHIKPRPRRLMHQPHATASTFHAAVDTPNGCITITPTHVMPGDPAQQQMLKYPPFQHVPIDETNWGATQTTGIPMPFTCTPTAPQHVLKCNPCQPVPVDATNWGTTPMQSQPQVTKNTVCRGEVNALDTKEQYVDFMTSAARYGPQRVAFLYTENWCTICDKLRSEVARWARDNPYIAVATGAPSVASQAAQVHKVPSLVCYKFDGSTQKWVEIGSCEGYNPEKMAKCIYNLSSAQ